MKKFGAMLAALAACGLVACGGGSATSQETGSIALSISGPSAIAQVSGALRQAIGEADAASKITTVFVGTEAVGGQCNDLATNGAYMTYAPEFPITDSKSFNGFNAGCVIRVFAWAQDASFKTIYQASSNPITIVARQVIGLNLVMQQVVAPGSVDVTAPMISAITVSDTTPEINVPVTLAATVSPSPKPTYQWSASCPSDRYPPSFSSANALTTDLTMEECQGDATVTFSVTDATIAGAGGSITSTVSVVLPYVAQGVDLQGLTINSWPNVTSIRATSNAAPIPGGTVSLAAVASDPDNDPVTFSWSDDCGGSFDDENTLTPVWTAPNEAGKVCELKLTVEENDDNAAGHTDGHNSATFKLQVAPAFLTLTTWADVCDPSTWVCERVPSYPGTVSALLADGLHMSKTAPNSATIAFGPGSTILGVAGMAFSSVSYELTSGICQGGSPRFNVYLEGQPGYCAVECNNTAKTVAVGNTYTSKPGACSGVIASVELLADLPSEVVLANIKVNGIPVR